MQASLSNKKSSLILDPNVILRARAARDKYLETHFFSGQEKDRVFRDWSGKFGKDFRKFEIYCLLQFLLA